jgi:hypothetical protein
MKNPKKITGLEQHEKSEGKKKPILSNVFFVVNFFNLENYFLIKLKK